MLCQSDLIYIGLIKWLVHIHFTKLYEGKCFYGEFCIIVAPIVDWISTNKSHLRGINIKRVLSTPKELSKSGSDRRKSIGNLFKTNKQSRRVRHSSINENENDDYDSESISSSFSSSFSFLFGGRSFGSFRGSLVIVVEFHSGAYEIE